MGIIPDIGMIDEQDARDLINRHRIAIQIKRTAPKQSDGTVGAVILVDSGTSAKLYIKGKKQWWYIDLEKE